MQYSGDLKLGRPNTENILELNFYKASFGMLF